MKNIDSKFHQDVVEVGGYGQIVAVSSRISPYSKSALGDVEIVLRTENGTSAASIALSPDKMRELARNLINGAERLECLIVEAAEIFSKEAA
jgi:hypothetical protein